MVSLLGLRAAVLSLLLFGLFIGVWHLATSGTGTTMIMDPEYAKLVGASASQGKSAMPGPAEVGAKIWEHLKNPFYDRGSGRGRIPTRHQPDICDGRQRSYQADVHAIACIPSGLLVSNRPPIHRTSEGASRPHGTAKSVRRERKG